MSKLKSLKEFEVENNTLKNISGGLRIGGTVRRWGFVATCRNNRDDTDSWHMRDQWNGGSYEDYGIAWWGQN